MNQNKGKGKGKQLDGHLPLFDVSKVRPVSLRSPDGPTGAFDTDVNDEIDGKIEGDGEEAEDVLCGENGDAALGDNDDEVDVEEEGEGEEAEAVLCGENGDDTLGDTDGDVEIEVDDEGREVEAVVAGDSGDAGLGDTDNDGDFEIEGRIEVEGAVEGETNDDGELGEADFDVDIEIEGNVEGKLDEDNGDAAVGDGDDDDFENEGNVVTRNALGTGDGDRNGTADGAFGAIKGALDGLEVGPRLGIPMDRACE